MYNLNVLILVLEHVGFMQIAILKITSPYVVVHQEPQEIHLYNVESSQLQLHLVLILVYHLLVVQIVNAEKLMIKQFVHASLSTLEPHQIVDQNVL